MIKLFAGILSVSFGLVVLYAFVYTPNATEIQQLVKTESAQMDVHPDGKGGAIAKSETAGLAEKHAIAKPVDSYKGVTVFYNGSVKNVHGRNTTADGYNLGLKYQCVEFVKRFYLEVYDHKMPNSYGHAKEFFNPALNDGDWNKDRGMWQFSNGSLMKPRKDDVLIFGEAPFNDFGHIAIIIAVEKDHIEIIQQNPGIGNPSRVKYPLYYRKGIYTIGEAFTLGWLRMRS